MGQPVVHFEIGCRDGAKTQDFYAKLFDWRMEAYGPAKMISTGSTTGIQGHINSLGHEPHNYTIFYVMVDDVAAALAKAQSLGGKKIVGPMPVPGGSLFAWFADPEGNTIGLYGEPKKS